MCFCSAIIRVYRAHHLWGWSGYRPKENSGNDRMAHTYFSDLAQGILGAHWLLQKVCQALWSIGQATNKLAIEEVFSVV
jgi:hypothetical protein